MITSISREPSGAGRDHDRAPMANRDRGQLNFSECVLYGVFIDSVMDAQANPFVSDDSRLLGVNPEVSAHSSAASDRPSRCGDPVEVSAPRRPFARQSSPRSGPRKNTGRSMQARESSMKRWHLGGTTAKHDSGRGEACRDQGLERQTQRRRGVQIIPASALPQPAMQFPLERLILLI